MVPILARFIVQTIEKLVLFCFKINDELSFEGIAFEGIQDGCLATPIATGFCWLTKTRGLHSCVRIVHLTVLTSRVIYSAIFLCQFSFGAHETSIRQLLWGF